MKIIIEEMIQFFCCPHIFAWNRTVRTAACNQIFGCGKIAVCGISTVYIWKIVLSFLAVLLNYFASKYIVFRKRDE